MASRYLNGEIVIGLVDGFFMKNQRPDHAGDELYSGHPGKCYDALNIQYVCDLAGQLIHIVTGISGRAHVKNEIEWTVRLKIWLDNLTAEYCFLGDSPYVGYHKKCRV